MRTLISGPLPEDPEQTEGQAINRAVRLVSRAIDVTAQPRTYLFDIQVTTQDPAKSARIANALSNIYIEDQVDTKFGFTRWR